MNKKVIIITVVVLVLVILLIGMPKKCKSGTIGRNGKSGWFSKCEKCSAGTYSNKTECLPCIGGTYSKDGMDSCASCEAGKFSYDSSAQCKSCLDGTFSSSVIENCPTCEVKENKVDKSCSPCLKNLYNTNQNNSVNLSQAAADTCQLSFDSYMFTESLYQDMIPLQTQLCFNCRFIGLDSLIPYTTEEKSNWSMLSQDDRLRILELLSEPLTPQEEEEFMKMYPNDGTTPGGTEKYAFWAATMTNPIFWFPTWVNRFVPYNVMSNEMDKTWWYKKINDDNGKLATHTYGKIMYNLHQMVYASDPTKDWSVDPDTL